MEYLGLIAFVLVLSYSSYPGKVKKLEKKLKTLTRTIKGEQSMSKLINDLKGKRCLIKVEYEESALITIGSSDIECDVIDADDEWIKIKFKDKKDAMKTKIIRIEDIGSIELIG